MKTTITITLALLATSTQAFTGHHCWQQQPFEHVVCFNITAVNDHYYTLLGKDMTAAATYPTHGSALLTEGSLQLEFIQNLGAGEVYKNSVTLDSETLEGEWLDNSGNSGDFDYIGTAVSDDDLKQRFSGRRSKRRAQK
ncbi:MAG: hypothetical protein SVR94_15160 [Pseudomonadota bacterium]|nr:hypothetical protein [Pseudomonadota bacterium]